MVKKGKKEEEAAAPEKKDEEEEVHSKSLCPGFWPAWGIRVRSTSVRRTTSGFLAMDRLAEANGIRVDRKDSKALARSRELNGAGVLLAKPQTFMNLSGTSVKALVDKHSRAPADV